MIFEKGKIMLVNDRFWNITSENINLDSVMSIPSQLIKVVF